MLRQIDGKWVLLSKKTRRPLAYYRGEGKPSQEWVDKQEQRIQSFKQRNNPQITEAAYAGNIGMMELVKFHQKADTQQKKKLQDLITNNRKKEAWNLIQDVTGVKLHKSVHEEKKVPHPDILPKAGGGQDGTHILVRSYRKDTPGQLKEEQCNLYSYNQIKDLEKFADRLLNKFNVDIEFTRHFGERLSSDRNHPCIKLSELQDLFKRIEVDRASRIKRHTNGQFVIQDMQKDLNLPIVIDFKNGMFDVTVKTIMRKKNFLTSNEKIKI